MDVNAQYIASFFFSSLCDAQIKKHAATLLEVDTAVEEEARARADIEDQCGIADRKGEEEKDTGENVFNTYKLCSTFALVVHMCAYMGEAPTLFFIS